MTFKASGTQSYQLRYGFILLVILIAIYKVFALSPVSQDPAYHLFVDTRSYGTISNFANVVSNVGFIFAGIVGFKRNTNNRASFTKFMWTFFFVSVIGVGAGSAYYHWNPTNNTLFWDRLPMTLAFGSLISCIGAERFGARVGEQMFRPMVFFGALSVVYWWISEAMGAGDLRLYILVQYLPIALIPLVLIFFPHDARRDRMYWTLLLAYIIAKLFEMSDVAIFNNTFQLVSGHSLKHLAAAAGILSIRPPCDSI